MILQGKAKTPVTEVVLHCTGIKSLVQFQDASPFQIFATVNQWHIERGFKNGFGYHGLIMPSGAWYKGRPFEMVGAHVMGHNQGTLGFLLIERKPIRAPDGVNEAAWLLEREFSDWYTEAQRRTLRWLLADLASKGVTKVSGHNDYAPKLCPGFKVQSDEWLRGPLDTCPMEGDDRARVSCKASAA